MFRPYGTPHLLSLPFLVRNTEFHSKRNLNEWECTPYLTNADMYGIIHKEKKMLTVWLLPVCSFLCGKNIANTIYIYSIIRLLLARWTNVYDMAALLFMNGDFNTRIDFCIPTVIKHTSTLIHLKLSEWQRRLWFEIIQLKCVYNTHRSFIYLFCI